MNDHFELSIFVFEVFLVFETMVTSTLLEVGDIFYFAIVALGALLELEPLVWVIRSSGKGRITPRNWHFDTAPATITTTLHIFNRRWMGVQALHKFLDSNILLLVVVL